MKTALVLAVLLVAPRLALADWPACGRALETAPKGQVHAQVTTDGLDGAIVTWRDQRSVVDNVFAQRILSSGDLAWPGDGVSLIADTLALAGLDGGQFNPTLVADGSSGAIVVWEDLRNEPTAIDLFAMRIRDDGSLDPAWPVNGLPVIIAPQLQVNAQLVTDGEGGAIVVWTDTRSGTADVYAQHILVTGVKDPAWPTGGLVVCDLPGAQNGAAVAPDGFGGVLVAWSDPRGADVDIFAQHVLVSGTVDPAWPAQGRAICTAPGDQGAPNLVPDGAHGAVIAWGDARPPGNAHVFAEHVRANGTLDPAWPVNGRQVSNAAPTEGVPFGAPDGSGGAVFAWAGSAATIAIYANHVRFDGTLDPAWPAGGRTVSDAPRLQFSHHVASDGAGGAIVAWQDSETVVARRVRVNGQLDPLKLLCSGPGSQAEPHLVSTAGAGAIVAWTDSRLPSATDIFALQFTLAETVDVPSQPRGGLALAHPVPSPARSSTLLRYALPHAGRVALAIVDVTGRRVRTLAAEEQPAGEHAVPWDLRDDRGALVPAGLYFVRLEAEGRSIGEKVLAIR